MSQTHRSPHAAKEEDRDLDGIRIVLFALNLPGPAAGARLAARGAHVVKFEPLSGEPFADLHRGWYEEMHAHIETRRVDLRTVAGREQLASELAAADVLITAFRHASLARLHLDNASIRETYPRLCHVAIVGHRDSLADVAGHDLTYQASSGLLHRSDAQAVPPMPSTLLADFVGVERAVASVYALLFARARGRTGLYAEIALADGAHDFAVPARLGLTAATGFLGGANPFYAMYATADGVVALAALEEKFWRTLVAQLPVELGSDQSALAALTPASAELSSVLTLLFAKRTAAHSEAWGRMHDIPLAAVQQHQAQRET